MKLPPVTPVVGPYDIERTLSNLKNTERLLNGNPDLADQVFPTHHRDQVDAAVRNAAAEFEKNIPVFLKAFGDRFEKGGRLDDPSLELRARLWCALGRAATGRCAHALDMAATVYVVPSAQRMLCRKCLKADPSSITVLPEHAQDCDLCGCFCPDNQFSESVIQYGPTIFYVNVGTCCRKYRMQAASGLDA